MSYKKLLRTITVLAFSCQTALCFAGRDDDLPEPQAAAHQVTVAVPATNVEMPESAGEGSGSVQVDIQEDDAALSRMLSSGGPDLRVKNQKMLDRFVNTLCMSMIFIPGAAPFGSIIGTLYNSNKRKQDPWTLIKEEVEALVNEKIDQAVFDAAQDDLNGLTLNMIDFNTLLYRLLLGQDVAERARDDLRGIDRDCVKVLPKLSIGTGDADAHNAHMLMPLAVQQGLLHLSLLQAAMRYKDVLKLPPDEVDLYRTSLQRALGSDRTYSYPAHIQYWYDQEMGKATAIAMDGKKTARFEAQIGCKVFYTLGAFDFSWAFPFFDVEKYPDGAPTIYILDRTLHQGPLGTNMNGTSEQYVRSHPPSAPLKSFTFDSWPNPAPTTWTYGYECRWTDDSSVFEGDARGNAHTVDMTRISNGPARSFKAYTRVVQRGDEPVTDMQFGENESGAPYMPSERPGGSYSEQALLSIEGHILVDVILQSTAPLHSSQVISCLVPAFKHETLGLPRPGWSDNDYAYAPAFLGDLVANSLEGLKQDAMCDLGSKWREQIEPWFKSSGQATGQAGTYNFADVKKYVADNWESWQASRDKSWQERLHPTRQDDMKVSAAGPSASAATV